MSILQVGSVTETSRRHDLMVRKGSGRARDYHRWSAVRQVRDLLRARIVLGGFGDGAVPGEQRLIEEYGVSRGVVRDALDLLRAEGLIERLQGAGTFVVAQSRIRHGLDVLRGLPDEIEDGQYRITYQVLDMGLVPAPPIVAERLSVAEGAEVVFFERLTVLDALPLTLRSSWFPWDIGAPLLKPDAGPRGSIYQVIERQLGHQVGYTDQLIEATVADHAVSQLLKTPVGAPILLLERLVHLTDGRPVEFGFGRNRGDRMALTDVMRRRTTTTATVATTTTTADLSKGVRNEHCDCQ
jgi:GntR family transcriptional regulator